MSKITLFRLPSEAIWTLLNLIINSYITFSFNYQAKSKVRKAEKALAKVQEFLKPADLPIDLETVSDEERALFRNIGLKMRGALLLGKISISVLLSTVLNLMQMMMVNSYFHHITLCPFLRETGSF